MADCRKSPVANMKHRVAVQSIARVSDGQGGFTESWSTDATVWAWVRPVKGFEKFQAAQLQSPVTHKVTIRYRTGVTTKQRLLLGTRVLAIREVLDPGEGHTFLELTATEQQ